MYANGLGIPTNPAKPSALYESAAEAGEFDAQIALGRIYSKGIDVAPNPELAPTWYAEALAQADRIHDCEELREASRIWRASLHETNGKRTTAFAEWFQIGRTGENRKIAGLTPYSLDLGPMGKGQQPLQNPSRFGRTGENRKIAGLTPLWT